MSQRAKRPNRSDDGSVPVKRRKRTAAEEEEAASLAAWQPRSNDLKASSIYNRTTTEAPAELFRKDLISAMKLPDSEPLASNEYWVIVDQWKQEWERGVQVPVNPDSLPEPSVTITHIAPPKQHEFKLPKNKYIRITKDDNFKVEEHALSNAPAQAEAACSYDLDECDVAWLRILNAERAQSGLGPIYEEQLERVIEQLELSCWDKIQSILRNEEGLGIEYDENVICDVCRSPDSEEGNEMVFCDSCNICVHQACYGITRIPEGQWLCCTCNLSKRPKCVLCPNKGGAMKCTRSGQKWAHVSCALWIPEVSIGCVERMEPITKISSIPQSRWALICVLCRERVGACIQCSVKTCKTAYHVTCAFKHGLEMRAIIEDENADDGVKLRSYCEKHSKSSKKEKSVCSGSEDDDSKRKKRKDMTSEEKNQARAARLQEIESEFYKHVSIKDISVHLDVDNDALRYIYNYWKLKRKAGKNKPLLPPKSEDVDMLSHKREQADLEKMKMFVQLRQDLERVRNLCYMVSRREKLSRSFFRLREQTFHKQTAVLESIPNLPNNVIQAVIEANHGPSIYDRLYSHEDAEDHTSDFEKILTRIAGSEDEKKPELNGLFKDKNSYKKVYFNGTSKRRSLYGSSSSSSSEEEKTKKVNNNNNNNNNRRRKRHSASSTSEEEDDKKAKKNWGQYSRSRLMQVERELGYSGSDSDELMPIRTTQQSKSDTKQMSSIYSDSDSSDVKASDSQQNKLRTKAAVKEFSHKPSTSSSKKKETKNIPSDLIVPQRQAAKKATENLKSTTSNRIIKEQKEEEVVKNDVKTAKPKIKTKEVKKNDVFDLDKDLDKVENSEILAYVPQRQAAKKAAEHIKSGLGNKTVINEVQQQQQQQQENNKNKAAKVNDKRKSSSNSSSSSSSSSSSDSSTSTSSESDDDKNVQPPRSESQFSNKDNREVAKRTNAKDWPFLDKDVKPTASSSSSSTESSDSSRPNSPKITGNKKQQQQQQRNKRLSSSGSRSKQRTTSKPSDRIRDANVRIRNMSDSQRSDVKCKKSKSDQLGTNEKEITNKTPNKLQSPIRKTDKKLENNDISNLEKEILERKAGKQGSAKTKSTLDRLFGSTDNKKLNKKSTSPVKKSPIKNKEDVVVINEKIEVEEEKVLPKDEDVVIEKTTKEVVVVEDDDNVKPEEKKILENRSIFSPPHIKDNLLDFDNLDDGFGISKDEEVMKGPLTFNFGSSSLFKEDSKEDSARETLNLVEKLRMELSKKSTSCDVDDGASVSSSKNENDRNEFNEQVVPNINETKLEEEKIDNTVNVNLEMRVEVTKTPKCYNENEGRKDEEQIDYRYISCEADVPLELENKNIPIQQHHGLSDHGISGQGDERWVPPSGDNYTNTPTIDPGFGAEPQLPPPTSQTPQPLIQQYSSNSKPEPIVNSHLHEKPSGASPTPTLRISQTPLNNDTTSMDCMPSPSPYTDLHPQAKWADSEIMPNRRSSSSSAASTSSSTCSRRNDDEELKMRQDVMMVNHQALDMGYIQPPSLPFPPEFNSFTTETSQFISPVSLFPPPSLNTSLAFPSTGPTMFPPAFGAPFPAPQCNLTLPKPVENVQYSSTCTAAFTSSQHNMALTAAMVNLPPPVPEEVDDNTTTPNNTLPSPSPSIKSNNSSGKKSPSKPTRTSSRVTAKSPKQELVKVGTNRGRNETKRNSVKTNSSRGRGRGRGRGRTQTHTDYDFMCPTNTIHNKLVGTVYDLDFDDDITNENVDLKSMRERRKSSDVVQKIEKENQQKLDTKPLPTPPIDDNTKSSKSDVEAIFPVQPVLPGPVDMRTYNTNYTEANLLQAFASGTTETQVNEEIDEDFEKELHSALTIKKEEPPVPEVGNNIKVSLSDARNQLKVKIKGPIANYSSSVAPLPPPTVDPVNVSNMNYVPNSVINSNNNSGSGTSNLRRMRKKELLRQYCSQDMNMDESSCTPAPTVPPVNRTIITIPKAVASMTSIPTKDDYRDYRTGSDDTDTSKHRKETKARPGALSRELRQLDLSLDEDGLLERRDSKRRGRPPRPSTQSTTPKIKIKISNSSIVGRVPDDKRDRIRPPKKRLATMNMPSVEDLKRESMKFRKLVMADFGEKRKKKDKSEKRKRKKVMQIISNEGENPTKLIIRIGKKVDERTSEDDSAAPIKFKLSRCQEGSYVMKRANETKEGIDGGLSLTDVPPAALPLNKDCEVR